MFYLVIVENIIHRHYHSRVTDDYLVKHKSRRYAPSLHIIRNPFVVHIAFDHIAFIIFQKSQKVESETNERMKQYTIGTTFRNAVSRTHNPLDHSTVVHYCTIIIEHHSNCFFFFFIIIIWSFVMISFWKIQQECSSNCECGMIM